MPAGRVAGGLVPGTLFSGKITRYSVLLCFHSSRMATEWVGLELAYPDFSKRTPSRDIHPPRLTPLLGTFLLRYITEIAKQRDVKRFYGTVLPNNEPMLTVFRSSGYEVKSTFDGHAYDIRYNLTEDRRRDDPPQLERPSSPN